MLQIIALPLAACAVVCCVQVRSPVFKALLDAPMREGKEGVVTIQDVRAPVFRTLLHFVYTDSLPEVRCLDLMLYHRRQPRKRPQSRVSSSPGLGGLWHSMLPSVLVINAERV